jgi:hypothetical protein
MSLFTKGENMQDSRRRLLVLAVVGTLLAIAGVAIVAVMVLRDDGPGLAAAESFADDYVAAENEGDCSHIEYLSEHYLEERDLTFEKCKEDLEFEPAYYQFELVDVRVDGDEGEIEIETYDDINDYTLIASLVVEDGEWKVDDLEEADD